MWRSVKLAPLCRSQGIVAQKKISDLLSSAATVGSTQLSWWKARPIYPGWWTGEWHRLIIDYMLEFLLWSNFCIEISTYAGCTDKCDCKTTFRCNVVKVTAFYIACWQLGKGHKVCVCHVTCFFKKLLFIYFRLQERGVKFYQRKIESFREVSQEPLRPFTITSLFSDCGFETRGCLTSAALAGRKRRGCDCQLHGDESGRPAARPWSQTRTWSDNKGETFTAMALLLL